MRDSTSDAIIQIFVYPGEPRPTLATLVEADLAVAQAVQNLNDLKVNTLTGNVKMISPVEVQTSIIQENTLQNLE